jgi:SAM-dependent methyltransferase
MAVFPKMRPVSTTLLVGLLCSLQASLEIFAFGPAAHNVRQDRLTLAADVSCHNTAQPFENIASEGMSRRQILSKTAALSTLTCITSSVACPSLAAGSVPFSATWSAVDGLNKADDKKEFVAFDISAYRAMRDDKSRTPFFERAIAERLGKNPESQTVLDLGTGPFALFAILAASLGAGKVYAIEASPNIARSAREFVKKSGYQDVITVIQGFSTEVNIPEKADFCIAEIVGSIVSEEGAYSTIRDAHRFLKEPTRDDSWIPCRIQTYAAPASYSLHNLLGPPDFDWNKLNGEPVRFNCRDKGLELLSDPVLVEDVVFADILSKAQDVRNNKKELTFTVDLDRIDDNALSLYDEFRRDGRSNVRDSEILAYKTAHSFSGVACWPRIFLNDDLIVNSRSYPHGDHQQSHWQSVLPIMSGRPIGDLKGGERIQVSLDFKLPTDVQVSPKYHMNGVINY